MTNKEIITIATNDDIMNILINIKEEMSSFGALNGMNKRYQQKKVIAIL
jgi:hypothetical protein